MALRTRKVSGAFEKRAPGNCCCGRQKEPAILISTLPLQAHAPQFYSLVLKFSFAAVFWDVTQRSPQRNRCSHPNNIPFHCLANHSFRSIFENLVAPNSSFEICPIRDHFLSSHHMVGNSYINNRPLYSCLLGDLAFGWQRG